MKIDWAKFGDYLDKNFRKNTSKARFSNAQKYCYVLLTGDARELMDLSFDKRIHAMKSLSALSKFLGRYDEWKQVVDKYQLKWSDNGYRDGGSRTLETFHKIFSSNNFGEMLSQLKKSCLKLNNQRYSEVMIFCTLTGLRPAESCTSLKLLRDRGRRGEYLNKENMMIEHFRFPSTFLRRTKNAYVSIVSDNMLDMIIRDGGVGGDHSVSYNSLRLAMRRQGLKMNMSICRKIFATYLRQEGVEQEIIDLLQGRIPKSVFVMHYYRPDYSRFAEIRNKLDRLYDLIVGSEVEALSLR
jgi:hypothetical protein